MFIFGAGQGFELNDFAVGDVVVYSAFGGERRRVAIKHLEEDLKNNRSGFTGVMVDADNKFMPNTDSLGSVGVWGYVSQIIEKTGQRVVFDKDGNLV